jgi:hypothetical protein
VAWPRTPTCAIQTSRQGRSDVATCLDHHKWDLDLHKCLPDPRPKEVRGFHVCMRSQPLLSVQAGVSCCHVVQGVSWKLPGITNGERISAVEPIQGLEDMDRLT